MSKILVDSGEYFKLKNRINELLETNKKLKEKYVYLEKKIEIEEDLPTLKEKNEQLNKNQIELNIKLSNIQKENEDLKDANKELTITKDNIEKQNIELNETIEELKSIKKINTENNYKKEGISICLTAWQTQNYIEECLDSIEVQTYFEDFDDYEILLGIDACQETLEKVKKIRYKYRNLRVFMMNQNVGTYITTNTIMSIAKYDWLLRFDTDDIMMSDMISNIMKLININSILRCSFKNFGKNLNAKYKTGINYAHGILVFNRKIFYTLGGFKPWLCGADSDFIERAYHYGYLILSPGYNHIYFKRRIHGNSLTSKKDTMLAINANDNKNGALRDKYNHQLKDDIKNGIIKICTVTSKYTEII